MEDLERLAKLDPNNKKSRLSTKSNTKPKQPTDSKVDTLPKCLHKNVENDSDDGRFSETDGEDEGEEEEDIPATAIHCAAEQLQIGRNVIGEEDILNEKAFELCCLKCPCDEESHSDLQIEEILPSHSCRDDADYLYECTDLAAQRFKSLPTPYMPLQLMVWQCKPLLRIRRNPTKH